MPATLAARSTQLPFELCISAFRLLLDRVELALERLPEHYRVVVWLRDGEDLSYQEIAETLDVPIGTVRSRLARARAALKELVES